MVGAVDDDLTVEVFAEQSDRRFRVFDSAMDGAADVFAFELAGPCASSSRAPVAMRDSVSARSISVAISEPLRRTLL